MSRREKDLDRELRFHLEQHVADLMARGVPRDEAERRARQELGGVEQVREQCRQARPLWWLERLGAETRYALRNMRRSPAWAATLVLTVAVCVAVNTAVFTVVDSLLLRPLPFPDAGRLVTITNQYPKAGITDQDGTAAGDLADRRQAMPALAEHALFQRVSRPVEHTDSPLQLDGFAVTPSLFPLLRVLPAEGRVFTEAESEPGKHRVVVLTAGLRRELFGAETAAIGQTLRIAGETHHVIGVLPAGFRFVDPEIRYFVPLALSPEEWRGHHNNGFRYLARLRDGATIEQAQAQVNALNVRLLDQYPQFKGFLTNAGFYSRVAGFQPWLMRRIRPSLNLLWAGAALVLIIGSLNLAGISLARAAGQAREGATRLALGASRADMARHCLLESLAPALIGCVLGTAAALAVVPALDSTVLPGAAEIAPDPRVMLYALVAAALIGVTAGLASLLQLGGTTPASAMRDGSRGATHRHGSYLRRGLVAIQVALAFVLLNGAGVLVATLRELQAVRPGFAIDRVWTASTFLPGLDEDLIQIAERIQQAARETPGIEKAAVGTGVPFEAGYNDSVILAEGYTAKPGESVISPVHLRVSPDYFETLGIPLVEGRGFDARDDGRHKVIVIDEQLARRFWPGQSALGRRMYFANSTAPDRFMTVVGVARSIRLANLDGSGNPNGIYYRPLRQGASRSLRIVWRGGADTAQAFRTRFAQAAPGAALFELRSLAERRDMTLTSRRLVQGLVLTFAGVSVLLSAIGIYGLLAYLLSQRRREVGVRMALGCRPQAVFALFLSDGLALVAVGLAAGLAGALGARTWLAGHVYGVGALDPLVAVPVALFIVMIMLAAITLPAWRAARVDASVVLREG